MRCVTRREHHAAERPHAVLQTFDAPTGWHHRHDDAGTAPRPLRTGAASARHRAVGWEAAAGHAPKWSQRHWELAGLVADVTARLQPDSRNDWIGLLYLVAGLGHGGPVEVFENV